jgi:D-alanyl-lipoteichoic acid acyltransferase DltB (MBOAT superfamily)
MLFNSIAFLAVFLPGALAIYWALRKFHFHTGAIVALAAASYGFYIYGETTYPWLIVASIAFNYIFGRLISTRAGAARHLLFACAIIANLAALGYFKYANFFTDNLRDLTGISLLDVRVILPIGISFFTFTQIAFLVDAYRGLVTEADPIRYFLFVTFFPHLIAGPILHHKEMMPQFARRDPGRLIDSLGAGIPLFAIGLFKKSVIADSISLFVTPLFAQAAAGHHLTLLEAWMAALGYTAQIYFDFSGYSDMAIGLGRMFAIDLPINFNSPYKSTSIIEFWRRWHITLSRFLRDYLYIPLGGNRRGPARRYVNLFATMVLGGMWHGAGWTFLLWGALHGFYLFICHLWQHLLPRLRLGRFAGGAVTLLCVVFAWVPFRATSLPAAINIWLGMCGMNGLALPNWSRGAALLHATGLPVAYMAFGSSDVLVLALALLACLLLPNSQEWMARFRLGLDTPGYSAIRPAAASRWWGLRWNWQTAVVSGLILGIALRFVGGYSEFIYFQF